MYMYDYRLDDGGVSRTAKGEEEEEEERKPVAKAKVCHMAGVTVVSAPDPNHPSADRFQYHARGGRVW